MKYSKFFKGLTILSSLSLVFVFLLYRTGKLDTYFSKAKSSLQTSDNGGAITSEQDDSTKPKTDSAQRLMLSSSKSVVLTDLKSTFPDSANKKQKAASSKLKKYEMMSSSKSTVILDPQIKLIINLDSLKHDTLKAKK